MIWYPFKSVGRGFNLAGVLGDLTVVIAQSLGDISANHKGALKSFWFSTLLWPLPNAKWKSGTSLSRGEMERGRGVNTSPLLAFLTFQTQFNQIKMPQFDPIQTT